MIQSFNYRAIEMMVGGILSKIPYNLIAFYLIFGIHLNAAVSSVAYNKSIFC